LRGTATHTTDPAIRAAFVAGLRALANFLTAHPDLPVPVHGWDVIINTHGTKDQQRAEVHSIATLLNVTPDMVHLRASRRFGPIEYRTVAIPPPRWPSPRRP
jgi:hypothetical protein